MADKEKPTTIDIEKLKLNAKQKPEDLEAQCSLGWAYFGLDQAEDAKAIFESAAAHWPGDLEVNYGLGMALKKLGLIDPAKASFMKAFEAEDNSVRKSMLKRLAEKQINVLLH